MNIRKVLILSFASLWFGLNYSWANQATSDPELYGVWIPKIYNYDGKSYEIFDGLMVITPTYIIANAIYDLGENKPKPDANANFGTYRVTEPGTLIMDQAMQLHWRSSQGSQDLVEGDGTFFNQDVPETIKYELKDNNTLIFYFQVPGDQNWVMKRAIGEDF